MFADYLNEPTASEVDHHGACQLNLELQEHQLDQPHTEPSDITYEFIHLYDL